MQQFRAAASPFQSGASPDIEGRRQLGLGTQCGGKRSSSPAFQFRRPLPCPCSRPSRAHERAPRIMLACPRRSAPGSCGLLGELDQQAGIRHPRVGPGPSTEPEKRLPRRASASSARPLFRAGTASGRPSFDDLQAYGTGPSAPVVIEQVAGPRCGRSNIGHALPQLARASTSRGGPPEPTHTHVNVGVDPGLLPAAASRPRLPQCARAVTVRARGSRACTSCSASTGGRGKAFPSPSGRAVGSSGKQPEREGRP